MLSVGFEARSDLRQRTERYKMRARNSEATDQGTELTTKCIAPVRQDENLAGTRSSASLDSLVENGDTVKCIPILWKQHDGDAEEPVPIRWKRKNGDAVERVPTGHGYAALCLVLLGLTIAPAGAVILRGSGDPAFNTTPPTGSLADSGRQ